MEDRQTKAPRTELSLDLQTLDKYSNRLIHNNKTQTSKLTSFISFVLNCAFTFCDKI